MDHDGHYNKLIIKEAGKTLGLSKKTASFLLTRWLLGIHSTSIWPGNWLTYLDYYVFDCFFISARGILQNNWLVNPVSTALVSPDP